MNSETVELCTVYAMRANAIMPCPNCESFDIIAEDSDAESKAYAMVTNAHKRGEFGASGLEEVRIAMKSALANANFQCPSCDRERD